MCKKLYFLISFVLVLGLAHPSIVKGGLDNDPNLVGYWKLNEGSGTVAIDSSASDQNGIVNGGPTWGTGSPWDGSRFLDFDGDGDWVDINSIPDGKFLLPNYTISVWFRDDNPTYFSERNLLSASLSFIRGGQQQHGMLLSISRSALGLGRLRYIHRYPFSNIGGYMEEISPATTLVFQ